MKIDLAELWADPPEGQALIMKQGKKPVRIFLNANENDFYTPNSCLYGFLTHYPALNSTMAPNNYSNVLEANNKTVEALMAMGYDTRFAYGLNACHGDADMIYQDIPNTLVWAWDEWKKKQQQKATYNKTTTSSAVKRADRTDVLAFLGSTTAVLTIMMNVFY